MATRERPSDRASRRAVDDVRQIGRDIRAARLGAGLSLRIAGVASGVSASHLRRIECGDATNVTIGRLARIGGVVGLDIRVRAYAGPDPLRDVGQRRVMDRFRSRLPRTLRLRTEVTLAIDGDLRAWDGRIEGLDGQPGAAGGRHRAAMPVEVETRITDWQALQRRLGRKQRDAREPYLLLVVSDTRSNRDALAAVGDAVSAMFPVSARSAFASLAAGRHPGGSALLFV